MEKRTIAFEIGTEELPAFALHDATKQVKNLVCGQPGKLFDYDEVQVYSTPRRIIVIITGVPEETPAFDEEFRGPAARIAFDADGNPTKAAAGFARGKGVAVEDLIRKMDGTEEYVFAVKHTDARRVADMLPGMLGKLITDISWPKAQRWGSHNETFSRPVRWIVTLFGEEVIPLTFAGVESGRETRGHRFLAPGPFTLHNADRLIDVLRANYVCLRRKSAKLPSASRRPPSPPSWIWTWNCRPRPWKRW